MFRLDTILEHWAEIYKPLSHNPEHRNTFFRVSEITGQSRFIRNFTVQPSPCMAYLAHIDAEVAPQNYRQVSYRHTVYFLVRQMNEKGKTDLTDEDAAADARYSTDEMAQALLSMLHALVQTAATGTLPAEAAKLPASHRDFILRTALDDTASRTALRGLRLTEAHWGTMPVQFNGWQVCGMTIEQIAPRNLCINPEDYTQE